MDGLATTACDEVVIEIGRIPVQVCSESSEFLQMIAERYSGFVNPNARPVFELDVDLVPPGRITEEEDLSVRFDSGRWLIERGDLRAEWEPASRHGRIIQSPNPYSIDAALRIIHSLILAEEGGLWCMLLVPCATAEPSYLRESPEQGRRQFLAWRRQT